MWRPHIDRIERRPGAVLAVALCWLLFSLPFSLTNPPGDRHVIALRPSEPCEVAMGGEGVGVLEAGVSRVFVVEGPGAYMIDARSSVDGARWMRRLEVDVPGEYQVVLDFAEARIEHAEVTARLAAGEALEPGAGSVTEPRAVKRTMAKPKYPRQGAAMRRGGTVVLQARIERDGTVSSATVVSAPDELGFAEAAIAAVKKWRFEPATYHGEPVPVLFPVSFTFGVQDRPPTPPVVWR